MKNKLWFKMLVPVLIVAVIGIMWFIKNSTTDADIPILTEPTGDQLVGADFSLNATELIDYEALSEYGLPIIVDYGADSCIPCKQMAPVLRTLNAEMQGKAFIKFVDVWQYYEAAANVPVQVIPTQIFVNADGAVARGKTQNGLGVRLYLGGNDLCALSRELVVIFANNDLHISSPLIK